MQIMCLFVFIRFMWINDWTWAEEGDLSKPLGNPFGYTISCQLMCSNKLENSMPPLMSKAIQPIIINMFFDQQFKCENHLHYIDLQRIISLLHQHLRRSNGCKVQVLKLGHLVICFLKLDDRMDEGVH